MSTPSPTPAKPADPTKTAGAKPVASSAMFRITGKPAISETYIKILFYGAPGCGKTTLAASAVDVAQMQDVLYIDAERGEMTLDDNDRILESDKIDRVRVNSFNAVASVQEFLKAHCIARDAKDMDKLRRLEAMAKGCAPEDIIEPRQYRTVVVDSLTELDQFCMYQLLKLSPDMKLNIDDMEVAEWGEFRKNNQMMQLLCRAYRDLPMNVIFIAHAQFTQDEMKRRFYAPALTGKLAGQLQGFMDVVGYLITGKVAEGQTLAPRRLMVQPVGQFEAKNRRSFFKEAFFDNPTMTTIMKGMGLLGNASK